MKQEEYGIPETNLDRLLERYREACGSPEAGANFMPQLWQRIEAKQAVHVFFQRIARTCVASAVALSGILGIFLALDSRQSSPFYSESYVEEIATYDVNENTPYFYPVQLNTSEDRGR